MFGLPYGFLFLGQGNDFGSYNPMKIGISLVCDLIYRVLKEASALRRR